jgi:hypothetical protein
MASMARRLATRYEKRAEHYCQWLCLGISLIYTRRTLGHDL